MTKFSIDAPKQRVIKSLEILGFRVIREGTYLNGTNQPRRNKNSFDDA